MTSLGTNREGRDMRKRVYITDLREGPNEPGAVCPPGSTEAEEAVRRAVEKLRKGTRNHKARYGFPDDGAEEGGDA